MEERKYWPEGTRRLKDNPLEPNIGENVAVKVLKYSCGDERAYVDLGHSNYGFIRRSELFLQGEAKANNVIKNGTKCFAKVVEKDCKGMYELSRKEAMEEALEHLKKSKNTIINAKIVSISKYGLFLDLGFGISTLLHKTEISCATYDNLSLFFNVGDFIKVKILCFVEEDGLFYVSHIQAFDNKIKVPEIGDEIIVTVTSELRDRTGYFVEFHPSLAGIMDIPEETDISPIKLKSKCLAKIKRFTNRGMKLDFVKMID